jgi:hypothetical protein
MRLTGVTDVPLRVELFAFGPDRAEARGFQVTDCRRLHYPPDPASSPRPTSAMDDHDLPIVHDGLRSISAGAAVVTRLEATLLPSQMSEDVRLSWVPFQPAQRRVMSTARAYELSGHFGSLAALAIALGGAAMVAARRRQQRAIPFGRGHHLLAMCLGAVIVGVSAFMASNPQPTREQRKQWSVLDARSASQSIYAWLADETGEDRTPDIATANERLRACIADQIAVRQLSGTVSPEQVMAIGDAPAGIELRPSDLGIEVCWYDGDGAAHRDYPVYNVIQSLE